MQLELDVVKQLSAAGRSFELRASIRSSARRVVLCGPSGSGKSLTLRILAGLASPDQGRIAVNGVAWFDADGGVNLPARMRGVGFVFQDYALFPHLSVVQNIGYGLSRLGRPPRGPDAARVQELLEMFGLEAMANNRPRELSGGQRQRVALARALARRPALLLLDEPFSALDIPLRERLQQEMDQVLDHLETPVVLVTHDPAEANRRPGLIATYESGRITAVEETKGQPLAL